MEFPAARVGALSRNPAGIKAIRQLRDQIGHDVELVLLADERAIVVAALSDLTLQPRPLSASEKCLVRDPHHPSAATPQSFARRVEAKSDDMVVLSVHTKVSERDIIALTAAADQLAAALDNPVEPQAAAVSGGRDPVAILATQRDVSIVLDQDFTICYCNQAVLTTFGWTPQELIGRTAAEMVHPDDIGEAIGSIMRLQKAEEIYRVRIRFLHASGEWTPVSVTAIDQSNHPGVRGITVSIRPAEYEDETTRSLKVLEHRANTDQLTGLANRHSLHDSLLAFTSKLTNIEVPSGPIAACFVGIDHFKAINDIHGHGIGDQALRIAAARLRSVAAQDELLARIGGDEFMLVLVDEHRAAGAQRVAELMRAVLNEPYEIAGNRLHLTVSIGIALHDQGDFTAEALLQNADIALTAAKDRGGDQIATFDAELASAGATAQNYRNIVRDALTNDGLHMHYQPIVDVRGKIVGFEALARCVDAAGETHMPSSFIPAISGTSLLVQLDRHGFEQSCKLAAEIDTTWPEAGLFVSCNFSANSLTQSDFVEHVLTTIMRTGARPSTLAIEITESAAFEAGHLSIKALAELRQAKVGVALDDFGTGYSSLSHLRDLPLSAVKIDRSFVTALSVPGPEQTITRAITELARALGFIIIAEGIETEAQVATANLIGIDRLQGWYFDKALSAADARSRLQQHFSKADDGESASRTATPADPSP